MAPLPALYRLADRLLDGGLAAFLRESRAEDKSWDWIAAELYARTDRQVHATPVTLAKWYQRLDVDKDAA